MLSFPHLVVIFLVALIVLGPEKLPQVARVLGKAMGEFNRITADFRSQLDEEMRNLERQSIERQTSELQAQERPLGASQPAVNRVPQLPAAKAAPALSPSAVLPEAPGEPVSPEKPADVEPKPA